MIDCGMPSVAFPAFKPVNRVLRCVICDTALLPNSKSGRNSMFTLHFNRFPSVTKTDEGHLFAVGKQITYEGQRQMA